MLFICLTGAIFGPYPGDSGRRNNVCIQPSWNQIIHRIAKKTTYPLCKNNEEAQIVACAARALGQIRKFPAEMAKANPMKVAQRT